MLLLHYQLDIFCRNKKRQYNLLIAYFSLSPVSYIQAGGGWLGDARTIRSRGQILHRVPSPAERRSDHPGELPQPDHTGNHPPPGSQRTVLQQWMVG